MDNEPQPELLRVDPSLGAKQTEKLSQLKETRDNVEVSSALEALETAAKGSENLMPYIIDCVKKYCTIGEICGVLRQQFGEYQGV
jgi:methylmalonyl-CoA mutase, N-terminal domain